MVLDHVINKTPVKTTGRKITVNNIYIIDCSGSMGSRFSNSKRKMAFDKIREEIEHLKDLNAKENINHIASLIVFDDNVHVSFKRRALSNIQAELDSTTLGGMTALRDAMSDGISLVKKGEHSIIKMFTDGGENGSRYISKSAVNELIKSQPENVTVTIQCVKRDLRIIRELFPSIDQSNINTYENTIEGVELSANLRSVATKKYTKSLLRGESVNKSFYSKVKR